MNAPQSIPQRLPENSMELALACVIWKLRHHLPALVVQITPAEHQAFLDSLTYTEQSVRVNVEDRKGTMLVHLTDATTGDQIVPIENNEADLDRAQTAKRNAQLKQTAGEIGLRLHYDMMQGNFSQDTIEQACEALKAFALS